MVKTSTLRKPEVWDRLVNDKWGGQQPVLSPEASMTAAKRLYRKAMGRPFKGDVVLTSGNRHNWVYWNRKTRRWELRVNPDRKTSRTRGLREIIHGISHYAHSQLHQSDAPHSRRQAQLEGRLVSYAIKSGWLEPGKLDPKPRVTASDQEPPAKPDKVKQRYERICNREAKWAAQLEQAERLLKKARRERKAYERRHGERVTG